MKYFPDRRLVRLCLLVLPVLFTLAWAPQGAATLPELQQQTASPVPVTEAGAVHETRENLTGFFAIGIIINVLLVAFFMVWAVGQWRKNK